MKNKRTGGVIKVFIVLYTVSSLAEIAFYWQANLEMVSNIQSLCIEKDHFNCLKSIRVTEISVTLCSAAKTKL